MKKRVALVLVGLAVVTVTVAAYYRANHASGGPQLVTAAEEPPDALVRTLVDHVRLDALVVALERALDEGDVPAGRRAQRASCSSATSAFERESSFR